MTEAVLWFFLVVGPVPPDATTRASFHDFKTRQDCWAAHAQTLSGKSPEWLLTHFVTPCGSHPAVLVPEK